MENSPSLMPLTFLMSSIVLNGRPSMMAWAFTGPMPGRASSSSLAAVLILTFWPGWSLGHGLGRRRRLGGGGCAGGGGLGGRGSRLIAERHQVAQRGDPVLAQAPDLVQLVDRLPGTSFDDRFRGRGADTGRSSSAASSAVLRFTLPVAASFASSTLDSATLDSVAFDFEVLDFGFHRRTHGDVRPDALNHPPGNAGLGQVVDARVGPAGDNLLGRRRSDTGKVRLELLGGGLVQVEDNLGRRLGL